MNGSEFGRTLHCTSGNDANEEDRFMEWKRARAAAAAMRQTRERQRDGVPLRFVDKYKSKDG